jgi:hypothetical protein
VFCDFHAIDTDIEQLELGHDEQSARSKNSRTSFDEQLVVGYTAREIPDVNDICKPTGGTVERKRSASAVR